MFEVIINRLNPYREIAEMQLQIALGTVEAVDGATFMIGQHEVDEDGMRLRLTEVVRGMRNPGTSCDWSRHYIN